MRRLLLLGFIWGWSFLFIKVAVGGMTPTTVAAARIALGALVLLAVLRVRRLALPTDRTSWRHFAVAALFGSALPFSLLAWGEERITSALTAVLNAATPLFTALIGAVVLRERLRPLQSAGLLVGLAGVAVAAGVGSGDLAGSSLTGSLASVSAGACYAVGFIYMKRNLMDLPAEVAATGQLIAGATMLAPFALWTTATEGIDLAPHRLVAIGLLGAVGTGVAYVLNYRVVADLGPTKASLVTYVIPVVAVVVGVVVLGEPFRLRLLAGGLLIVAGISSVHRRLRLPRRRPVTPVGGAWALAGVVALAGLLAGCGLDRSRESAGCGPVVEEDLDPGSQLHLLPGAPEPEYLSDPPTSGPHLAGPAPRGVLTSPLGRPVQVQVLEQGGVVVQHRDLDETAVEALHGLAGDHVVVAPGPSLPSPVVATAWGRKLTCEDADVEALRRFVDASLEESADEVDDGGTGAH
ncbi:MAG: EamA family transporter [Actinobacteria bacterium]|nr:EamA family transporter [Actinomycetota bacterium]